MQADLIAGIVPKKNVGMFVNVFLEKIDLPKNRTHNKIVVGRKHYL
jgi:hypothetical protein